MLVDSFISVCKCKCVCVTVCVCVSLCVYVFAGYLSNEMMRTCLRTIRHIPAADYSCVSVHVSEMICSLKLSFIVGR